MTDESVTLNPEETTALALLLIARQIDSAPTWLQWEDMPLLDEASFSALVVQVAEEAGHAYKASYDADRALGLDSCRLWERTQ